MAKTAVSKSWDRSAVLAWLLAGRNDHALTASEMAAHAPAPYHKARVQNVAGSRGFIDARIAIILFSKAYGTASLGVSSRAATISFSDNLSRFISRHSHRRPCVRYGYRYLARAIFARHFRISARARKARTFTKGTDQPVSFEISFTDFSSISNSVITSRAAGESCERIR